MPLNPAEVLAGLQQLGGVQRWLLGYSGGLDSTVLLHLLASHRASLPTTELLAIHVNHRLHPEARHWAASCENYCRQLGVDFVCREVVLTQLGKGLEAAARDARYAAFASIAKAGDCLLTAHHADDQLETLLLRLLRGSGLQGMAGIPALRRLGKASVYRPLLASSRADLETYARQHGIGWIEDPSNHSADLDRNYLRQRVVPQLKQRWPAAAVTAARVATHLYEAAGHLADYGVLLMQGCDYRRRDNSLAIAGLTLLAPARQMLVLRSWLTNYGLQAPATRRLQLALENLLCSRVDAQPREVFSGAEIRRFQGRLYLFACLPAFDSSSTLVWREGESIALPAGGYLRKEVSRAAGLLGFARAEISYRRGGERSHPAGRGRSSSLKKMLQEHAVPPWLRDRVPLLYIDGRLAAVGDYWLETGFAAAAGSTSIRLVWEPYTRGEKAHADD